MPGAATATAGTTATQRSSSRFTSSIVENAAVPVVR